MHKEHHGFIFGILAAISSTIGALLIKWTTEVPNETMVFARFAISLLCLLPSLMQKKIAFDAKKIKRHLIRGLAGLASIYCYFYSVEKLPLVNAITLSNTYVLMIPIVVFFWMKMIIPKMRVAAVVIGFIGVLLVFRPSQAFSEWVSLVGLLGGVFSAFALVGIRQLSKTEKTEEILLYYFSISALVSFVPMAATFEPIAKPILWLNLILIGFFSFFFQYCLTKSLTHAPATKVSSLGYLNVIFSGLLAWWFFNEIPSLWVVVGSLFIILGGLIALFTKETPRPWRKS